MRVEFVNSVGGIMRVDESRVEEYKAAGYMLAVKAEKKTDAKAEEAPKKKAAPKKKKEAK